MSKQEARIARLLSKPRDYTWDEAAALLKGFGYRQMEGSGSRVKFHHPTEGQVINMHKPHPGNELRVYLVKGLIQALKDGGFIQ